MMDGRWTGAAAFVLLGCQASTPTPSPIEVEARGVLDLALNDGQSARLRDVRSVVAPIGGKTALICGLVNAKNQMGAYAGWRRFILERGSQSSYISPDATDLSKRSDQAAQAAFESIYPKKTCPSSGYAPSGVVADAVAALQRARPSE